MSLTVQFYTMLAMVGMGSYFGVALDTYSRLFNRSKRNVIVRGMNDILFWIVQALITFYILYLVNNGEIRFYIFLALLCGFAFYQSLLKNLYNRLLEWLIQLLVRTYRLGVKLFSNVIIKPVVMFFTFIFTIIVALGKFTLQMFLFFVKILRVLLKIVLKPFTYLGKYIWKAVPKSFKIKGSHFFERISNSLKWIMDVINKLKRR
ncbi:spore cortex biosynthesis protein YabQ [Caldifermentibacillus hisashii]|uniref:spore cortex biosynthesis protein YabQ n=1 Tax=Caldifermentibacillus hisashii TaxID=996558 RepID=UPI0031FC71BC